MTLVSSKEFALNQQRYFDLAMNEDVCIKNGENRFHLMYKPIEEQYPEQAILEPDDDLRRAITMEEFRKLVKEDIHQIYNAKK